MHNNAYPPNCYLVDGKIGDSWGKKIEVGRTKSRKYPSFPKENASFHKYANADPFFSIGLVNNGSGIIF